MPYRITSCEHVPDRAALDEMLLEYYGIILHKFTKAGGPAGCTPGPAHAAPDPA